ncbi:MAG: hypothetical protein ABIP89_04965 [Polyangiaceae bacterium]
MRRLGLAVVVASAGWVSVVRAVSPPPHRPETPLPSLPSIARVRIEAAKDHVLVIEEINLPRGTWASGDLDFFVAFGAPGIPRAFDAHLVSVADGSLEPSADDAGEPIAFERASHRPSAAHLLLGPAQMAGAVLHVREPAFRRAVSQGNMAAIRIRTLLGLPDEDAQTGREIVVRLGIDTGNPLVLGRLQLTSLEPTPWITRVEAHLCGNDADPYPLAIALVPRPASPKSQTPGPIAPVLAVRHATDSLCVRFWN